MPALVDPVLTDLPAEQPHLAAGGLLLRPWHDADAGALLEAYADPEVRRWHVEREDELVGRVTLSQLVLDAGQAEVTYWTLPAARGTGVAPAAVEAVSAWAFDAGFHRLELQHSTQNPSSCRVAEKAGFCAEGTKRSAGLHLDGWHDMHLHARLAPAPGGG